MISDLITLNDAELYVAAVTATTQERFNAARAEIRRRQKDTWTLADDIRAWTYIAKSKESS